MGGGSSKRRSLCVKELDRLQKETGWEEQVIQQWYSIFNTAAIQGHLTTHQFSQLYSKFYPKTCEFVEFVFRSYGTRRQGETKLDFSEYITAVFEASEGSQEVRLRRAFKMYDTDRDGFVDQRDLATVLRAQGELRVPGAGDEVDGPDVRSSEVQARLLMARLDREDRGRLTEEQFVKAMRVSNPTNGYLSLDISRESDLL